MTLDIKFSDGNETLSAVVSRLSAIVDKMFDPCRDTFETHEAGVLVNDKQH